MSISIFITRHTASAALGHPRRAWISLRRTMLLTSMSSEEADLEPWKCYVAAVCSGCFERRKEQKPHWSTPKHQHIGCLKQVNTELCGFKIKGPGLPEAFCRFRLVVWELHLPQPDSQNSQPCGTSSVQSVHSMTRLPLQNRGGWKKDSSRKYASLGLLALPDHVFKLS